jgi:DNA-binding transcriptional LysR family regulator
MGDQQFGARSSIPTDARGVSGEQLVKWEPASAQAAQPTVSHHLARLEAETGAQLLQRVGRGIRLTQAGQLLAERAAEIIGRIDAADAELAAHVGLTSGRVRLAGFSFAIGSLVPRAVAALAGTHPGLQISLIDTHPPEALELLRAGKIDVAVIFRYDETEPEQDGVYLPSGVPAQNSLTAA